MTASSSSCWENSQSAAGSLASGPLIAVLESTAPSGRSSAAVGGTLVASDEQAVDEDLEHRADGFDGQVALIDHARDSADEAGELE